MITLSRASLSVPCACHTSRASRITPPRSAGRAPSRSTPSSTGQPLPSSLMPITPIVRTSPGFLSVCWHAGRPASPRVPGTMRDMDRHEPADVADSGSWEMAGLGLRRAGRVVVLDPDGRVLLLRYDDEPPDGRHWATPGGGLNPGES